MELAEIPEVVKQSTEVDGQEKQTIQIHSLAKNFIFNLDYLEFKIDKR